MQHSLWPTSLLPFFNDRLFSGYTLGRWKPDPTLIHHAAAAVSLPMERCILVEDSLAGAQAGIADGIPVFYYCADPHNPPLDRPLLTLLLCDGAISGIMARARLDLYARAGAFVVVTTHNASQRRWQKRGNRWRLCTSVAPRALARQALTGDLFRRGRFGRLTG